MINVDPEFKALIPPLTDDERKQLEENILRDGIQDPLKIWQGTLIDGHNRYEIAQAHELGFTTVEMQFGSRADAIIWIIKNQFGRRNLSAYDRSILALKLKPVIAAKAKENLITHTAEGYQGCQKSDKAVVDTKKEIAKAAGVSHDTIAKVEKIEAQATTEVKAALKSGEISINAAYNKVQQAARKQDIQRQVEKIELQVTEQPAGFNQHQEKSAEIPSAGKFSESDSESEKSKPKLEVAAEMGFNKNQVSQFQQLADRPT